MTAKRKESRPLKLTPVGALQQAAEYLRTLAHPHRMLIVQMLLQGRYTVGELAKECVIPSQGASDHLRLMQRSGLLTSEKDGRKTYYQVAGSLLRNIMACVEVSFGR